MCLWDRRSRRRSRTSSSAMTAATDRDDVPRVELPDDQDRGLVAPGGPLVLIGGNCTAPGTALGAFLDLSQARNGGAIVGIGNASAEPLESAKYWTEQFQSVGIAS